MSVFTMIAIIVVTWILAKTWSQTRGGSHSGELKQLRHENEQLRQRLELLEHRVEEIHLLEDLSGDRQLAREIDRVADSAGDRGYDARV